MTTEPITVEKYNKLTSECISLTDENDHLKDQTHNLSTTLMKFMNMVLRMVLVMNKNGLTSEVNEIINP